MGAGRKRRAAGLTLPLTMVLRFSRFERASHYVSERQKTWTESLQAGALLGAIFAVSYVGVLLGGWSRLWH